MNLLRGVFPGILRQIIGKIERAFRIKIMPSNGARGQAIIDHQKIGSRVHLFVRKLKLEGGKAAPFIYCGAVSYESFEGEKPMNVTWLLDTSLAYYLLEELK